ncbi:hypothetical protein GCM10027294_06300 [Marinactinospora endophytica]
MTAIANTHGSVRMETPSTYSPRRNTRESTAGGCLFTPGDMRSPSFVVGGPDKPDAASSDVAASITRYSGGRIWHTDLFSTVP